MKQNEPFIYLPHDHLSSSSEVSSSSTSSSSSSSFPSSSSLPTSSQTLLWGLSHSSLHWQASVQAKPFLLQVQWPVEHFPVHAQVTNSNSAAGAGGRDIQWSFVWPSSMIQHVPRVMEHQGSRAKHIASLIVCPHGMLFQCILAGRETMRLHLFACKHLAATLVDPIHSRKTIHRTNKLFTSGKDNIISRHGFLGCFVSLAHFRQHVSHEVVALYQLLRACCLIPKSHHSKLHRQRQKDGSTSSLRQKICGDCQSDACTCLGTIHSKGIVIIHSCCRRCSDISSTVLDTFENFPLSLLWQLLC